jgi:RHS repeat-associated protein
MLSQHSSKRKAKLKRMDSSRFEPEARDRVTNRWNIAGLASAIDVQQPVSYFGTAYTYDAARRLKTISGTSGTYSNYYHGGLNSITVPSTLVQQRTLPNTAFITNNYDSLARLTSTLLRNGSTLADINLHSYAYNNGHQRTNQTRLDGSYVDYLYDDIGQLYSAKTYALGGTETTTQRRGYTYDAAWNLTKTTNNTSVTTRTVNNLNQITAMTGSSSFTHDANGNRTIFSVSNGALSRYEYDGENQLRAADKDPSTSSSPPRTEFVYDGKGRLRKATEYVWGETEAGSEWIFQSETRYIYSGMLAVQERSSANTPTVSYTRGWDMSGSLEGAGGIGGLLARSSGYSSGAGTWSTHNFYHADGNGNITAMVDSSQTLTATYKYDPYGNNLGTSGAMSSVNLYRFSSKLWCGNAGLYYYGYRFYDPNLQRWLNKDPLGELGGVNLYRGFANDPINRIDVFGLEDESGLLDTVKDACKAVAQKCKDVFEKLKGPNKPGLGTGTGRFGNAVVSAGEKAAKTAPGILLIYSIESACLDCETCRGAGEVEDSCELSALCDAVCDMCEQAKAKSHKHVGKL